MQSGIVDANLILFSLPVSAWVAAILLINEVPDIGADAATGKRTLPVRLGLGRTADIYVAIHSLAAASIIWMSVTGRLPAATPIVPLLLLLTAARSAGSIRIATENRDSMRRAIEATLTIHTIGSLWLTAAALFLRHN
jgi:1,4-dihydroxy-2-naphthoate octaprenyltransferase